MDIRLNSIESLFESVYWPAIPHDPQGIRVTSGFEFSACVFVSWCVLCKFFNYWLDTTFVFMSKLWSHNWWKHLSYLGVVKSVTRLYWQQEWPMLSYSIYVVCFLYVTFLLPPERAPKVLGPSLFQVYTILYKWNIYSRRMYNILPYLRIYAFKFLSYIHSLKNIMQWIWNENKCIKNPAPVPRYPSAVDI